ncbi:MAG: hypothetical protein EBW81_09560 [Gammaproteobacteria bacterium]|nr:hypothetical protein [Gammaproteobacteria bacterium]
MVQLVQQVLVAITTISENITLSGGAQLTFTGAVDSSAADGGVSATNNLSTIFTETAFEQAVGGSYGLGDIDITGSLSLDSAIEEASSLAVSNTSDIHADITTSGNQEFTNNVTLNQNVAFTTTSNGNVTFGGNINGAKILEITTNGTGDVAITGSIGNSTGLTGLTVSTDDFDAVAIKVGGDISITNTDTLSSTISGVISDNGATAATFTKAGAGVLTLTGNNTYTGLTTINAGTLTLNDADGGTGTVIADSTAITVNGGILDLDDSTETVGTLTLTSGSITGTGNTITGSSYVINPSSGTVTISANLGGTGIDLTKSGNGIYLSSGSHTYTGTTTLTAGTLLVGSDTVGTITSSAIGIGTFIVNGGTISSDSGSARTLKNAVSFTGNGTFGDGTNTGKLTFTGATELGNSADRTITVADSTTTEFSGIIGDGAGDYGILLVLVKTLL